MELLLAMKPLASAIVDSLMMVQIAEDVQKTIPETLIVEIVDPLPNVLNMEEM